MSAAGDRKVVFALLGIAALCLIGLGLSLYRSKSSELHRLERELAEKELQLEEVQAKLASQPELEAEYEGLQARLSVLEPALPDSAYIPTFLHQIEALALSTSNRILMIRPKPQPARRRGAADVVVDDETGELREASGAEGAPKAPKAGAAPAPELPYDQVPIELRTEGSYWTTLDFLQELKQFPKMIAVNDISLQPKQAGADAQTSPDLTAAMELIAVVTKGGSDGPSR